MVIIVGIFNESFRFFFKGRGEQVVFRRFFPEPVFSLSNVPSEKKFHEHPEKE